MRNDTYLCLVLTVIAAALVYLCAVLTPWPVVSAQAGRVVGARTPGESTGPAEVVIVGYRLGEGATLPVSVVNGTMRVTNEVAVTGEVVMRQLPDDHLRTVLIGHEERASPRTPGTFRALDPKFSGVPVLTVTTR